MRKSFRWPVLLIFAALLVAALVPVFPLLHARMNAHAAGSPSLSVSTTNIHVGQTITVSGQGFAPKESVNLALGGPSDNPLGSIPCDSSGSCTGKITIELYNQALAEGSYPLIGAGATSGKTAQVMVNLRPNVVLGIPQRGARSGSEAIRRSQSGKIKVGPGTDITVLGYSFAANEKVAIYLGTQAGILEGKPTTDAYGNLSFYFPTPTTLTPGAYTVTVVRSHQIPAALSANFSIIPPHVRTVAALQSGQPIRIVLQGFQAGEWVTFSWNANGGQVLGTFFSDPTGAGISCPTGSEVSCIYPPSVPPGTYTLTATGNTSGLQATTTFKVIPGITLNPSYAGPGSTIVVKGGGFTPGEQVKIYFQTPGNDSKGIVDSTGAFSISITAPTTYQQGVIYSVHATNTGGTERAKARFDFAIPSITTNDTVTFGSSAPIYGIGFQANETVDIYWNYQQTGQALAGKITVDSSGIINGSVKVPGDAGSSNVTLTAIGETSRITASNETYEYGALLLTPRKGQPGVTVRVVAGGFASNETVKLTFVDASGATTQVAALTSDARGVVKTTFQIPANAATGSAQFSAIGQSSNVSLSAQFQVG